MDSPLHPRVALLVLGFGVIACSEPRGTPGERTAASAQASAPVALRVGGPWSAAAGKEPKATGAFGYALELGKAQPILARHGFRFAGFVAFHNGPPIVQALQSGSIEVGIFGDTPAVSGKAGGVDTRAIVIDKPIGDAWLLARKGGPTRVAELAGKRVGLQFGSNFDKYGRGVLKDAGLLERVQLINIPIPESFAALTRGDLDAVGVPANTAATWLRKNSFPVLERASKDHPKLQGTSVTVVTSRFLRAHPTLPTAWWEAARAGIDEIRKDGEAYLRFVSEVHGMPLDAVRESMPLRFGDQPIDPEGKASVRSTLEFLLEFGTAKAPFSIDEWVVEGSVAARQPAEVHAQRPGWAP